LRDGARAVAPLSVAAAAFAVSFGVLAESAGMGAIAPIVMSATTFAGSAQFAAASILDDGGGVAAAVTAAVLLNLRYAPISISVAPGFEGSLPRRLVESQLIVDESWAVSHRGGGRFDHRVLLGAGLLLYPCWVGGTVLGALGGELIGDPNDLGLDAAFPALFLALLYPLLRTRATVAAAIAGAVVAIGLTPFAPPGIPIVAAAAVCLAGWRAA
jgi:predicted branched-subunit amino acid permease